MYQKPNLIQLHGISRYFTVLFKLFNHFDSFWFILPLWVCSIDLKSVLRGVLPRPRPRNVAVVTWCYLMLLAVSQSYRIYRATKTQQPIKLRFPTVRSWKMMKKCAQSAVKCCRHIFRQIFRHLSDKVLDAEADGFSAQFLKGSCSGITVYHSVSQCITVYHCYQGIKEDCCHEDSVEDFQGATALLWSETLGHALR